MLLPKWGKNRVLATKQYNMLQFLVEVSKYSWAVRLPKIRSEEKLAIQDPNIKQRF